MKSREEIILEKNRLLEIARKYIEKEMSNTEKEEFSNIVAKIVVLDWMLDVV